MFDCTALNPDVVRNPEESFFTGLLANQSQHFVSLVREVAKKHQCEIENKYGFRIEDIGAHLWRKCAHTKLNTGSTAGPSASAACIQGGH